MRSRLRPAVSIGISVVALGTALLGSQAGRASVVAQTNLLFGMQSVPKYDEALHCGAWSGSRARGMAMDQDLGVELSREGLIWQYYEPSPGSHPDQADFDDAVDRLSKAGIAVEEMATDTPAWAGEGSAADVPKGLYAPVFADGTDVPGPGKAIDARNPWARFLYDAASRYRGKVHYWQIWNEPDFPSGALEASADPSRSWHGSVQDYVRLLQVGYLAVKAADPAARIVTGGLGYPAYLQAILDRGGGRWFDAVDFHAYGYPGSDRGLEAFLKVCHGMRQVLMRNGLADKGLLCSETGYSAEEPDEQAAYVLKLYPTAEAEGLQSCAYYTNTNPSWKEMGLVDWHTMTQRSEGWWAYRDIARALEGTRFDRKLRLGAQAVGYLFHGPGQRQVAVLWAPYRDRTHPFALRWALTGTWQAFDLVGHRQSVAGAGTVLRLTDAPLVLDTSSRTSYLFPAPNPRVPRPGLPIAGVTVDSQEGGGFHDAPLAIDLDPDSEWLNGGYQAPEAWLSVALDGSHALHAVHMKTGPMPAGTSFDLEVQEDGRFVPVRTGLTCDDWGMDIYPLPPATRGAALRVHFYNRAADPVDHFGVFEIWIS